MAAGSDHKYDNELQEKSFLTLIRIIEITYVVVFLFTFCKQSYNKKFSFVYGTIILKKLSISPKSKTKQILTKNNQFKTET